MKKLFKFLAFLTVLQSLLPFLKPQDRSLKTLLWLPKLIAGALAPFNFLIGALAAIIGLTRKEWKLAGLGLIGAGLAAKFIEEVPGSQDQFEAAFDSGWEGKIPAWLAPRLMPDRLVIPLPPSTAFEWQQNLVFGQHPQSGVDLLADLWLPADDGNPSGLGIVYLHGSGWRVGDKDMGTRFFFQRLASQGHVILDIAYTLWPEADLPTMVTQANQAILWLKNHAAELDIDPQKVVLIGGSAGAHLALTAAYTAGNPAFAPTEGGDTSVCGAVAFYPPVDLIELQQPFADYAQTQTPAPIEKAADRMINAIFELNSEVDAAGHAHQDMIAELLGGTPDEITETYRLLSPLYQAGPHCPPTLLLQGADDVFDLAPGVRRLQAKLRKAGVPVVWVEFPHTEHAFDVMLPQISPTAQAALYDVERFLAMLI